jgi:hypothetical protein
VRPASAEQSTFVVVAAHHSGIDRRPTWGRFEPIGRSLQLRIADERNRDTSQSESRVERSQVVQAAHEEERADQENERDRELRHDDRAVDGRSGWRL